ncbi:MAG: circadian clock KaiB family protein [Candidatus Thiodiazotropha sp.]
MSSKNNADTDKYNFLLYIDSAKPKSQHVADRLRKLCHLHLLENFTLEVVDLQDNPALFEYRRVIAVPTLDIETPESQRHRFVGDLSNSEIFITAAGMMQEATRMAKQAVDIRNKIKPPYKTG